MAISRILSGKDIKYTSCGSKLIKAKVPWPVLGTVGQDDTMAKFIEPFGHS